ncbi:hypothetical protein FE257_011522 [Aspergillus nanangensis]|uniref:Uncharacterized protein n=1 Tax=Aspergillus nanangensis TaxID=2582783 RepID=A0AAD4GRC2_ASPNN|nr:hypothetical protein FE257_011522 [Aspergillus nanangensis]
MLIPRPVCVALGMTLSASLASAQDLEEQVWGVFAYTIYGDSIPSSVSPFRALTPYGANQLFAAGSSFRNEYVALHGEDTGINTRIESISPYRLDPEEINILSTTDPAVVASAQAFMQGLYPPLDDTFNATYNFDTSFQLSNGSIASGPLNGYQYPRILTLGPGDPQSTAINGQAQCSMHQAADTEYQSSAEVERLNQETEAFYQLMYDQALSGAFDRSGANYANAYYISEFLEYQSVHNETLLNHINQGDIDLARSLGDKYVFATSGNTSSTGAIGSGDVRTVAGHTLAALVLSSFDNNIEGRGTNGIMTLAFGSVEPAVALASLMQLTPPQRSYFDGRPALGASIIFELYSFESSANPTYPDPSQLFVRFILQNDTEAAYTLPLFGLSPSKIAMPYTEFRSEMENIAMNTEEWCFICNSKAPFCSNTSDTSHTKAMERNGLRPAVAGVIGAVVTLLTVAVVAIAGFLLCGMRMNRIRKASLGGFKGNSKMASDSDVTFRDPTWADAKEADTNEGEAVGRGHERVGSWEMRGSNRHGVEAVGSPFNDQIQDEWTHGVPPPAEPREHV